MDANKPHESAMGLRPASSATGALRSYGASTYHVALSFQRLKKYSATRHHRHLILIDTFIRSSPQPTLLSRPTAYQ